MHDADVDGLATRFRDFAADHAARAPFVARMSAAIADDPGLVAILAEAPPEQRLPVLLLAAIHDRVLADPGSELAAWFPTVTAEPRTDDFERALHAHCRDGEAELRTVVRSRRVQTNEVGRCGVFVPAFAVLEREVGPLAWVDVGTSGGLTLLLDRFEYEYRPGGSVGGRSTVRIGVDTRGSVPLPDSVPTIVDRIGLDRDPVDLRDPSRARWLRACVWPDQADRFERLAGAIGLATDHPVPIRVGDAVDDLAAAVDALDATGHPVVTNSWVLNYLEPTRRLEYVEELERIGRERDVSWVFAESPAEAVGLPFDESVAGRTITALVLVSWRAGRRTVQHLGIAHPHGYWLHWHDA